ncbi:MAG: AMP-binding protein, partial [Gaiella sp.]
MLARRPHEGVTAQHHCSSAAFVPFPDEALEQSLCARFAAQVAVHRSCLAVADATASLTYGELDGWANGIARAVRERVPDPPRPVALLFRQGTASTAAIIGVLKAGNLYVSLAPDDPRSAQMSEAVDAGVVLTDHGHRASAEALAAGRPVLCVDEIEPAGDPDLHVAADALAYVFFTSGSTGRPKGVYDTHRNVLHNVLRYTNTLELAPSDRLSLVQSPSFSATVSSVFSALLNGAAVFPLHLDPQGVQQLGAWVRDERLTVFHSVPALFRALPRGAVQSFPDVRIVRLEGDRATSSDVELHRRHFGAESVLVNGLGLTETGLVRQLFVGRDTPVDAGVLPVGYPVRDMEVLVVDDDGREVAAGVSGEIAVRSRFLAAGYWNDPELTARRFVASDGLRTYLTGDLGRLRDDGCLEHLGRTDGGLKILGNRVEPAEVEAELARLPGIRDAAVVIREGRGGGGRLDAFVVADRERSEPPRDLRAALARRVPAHMIPATFAELDELPLGPNGKVDRNALPVPPAPAAGDVPMDDLERLVARVWAPVLEVEHVAADDDFFALGGDSLAAAEIVAQLELETGTTLPVSVFASSPTLAEMAAALRHASAARAAPLVLRHGGDAAPFVLFHGVTGNLLHYAELLPLLGGERPVWGLEHLEPDDLDLASIAARHVRSLLAERPAGPFLLVGFCSGAAVAQEVACQLHAAGVEVPLLALLGFTPLDFPRLAPPGALERLRRSGPGSAGVVSLTRAHLAQAVALPARERPRYLARRATNVAARVRARIAPGSRRSAPLHESVQRAIAAHEPRTF